MAREKDWHLDLLHSLTPRPINLDLSLFQLNFERKKRWGFPLTCLTTRTVHRKVVPSMNTSRCVMGIERIVVHRGVHRYLV